MANLKNIYNEIMPLIDGRRMWNDAAELTKRELGQTFRDYRESAEYACCLLQEAGASDAKILLFPADGETVYQDKRMPLAWDAGVGKLSVIDAPGYQPGEVIADYAVHPFHLVKGSTSTPPSGKKVKIITEDAFHAGADAEDALVILNADTWPRAHILTPILERGGLGLISCFTKGGDLYPDSIQWVVASTEGCHWHPQCEDRPFLSFSVSPNSGKRLREAASKGNFFALAESDGHNYKGVLPAVTALIPGCRKKEIWLTAHLYEPLAEDNSSGVAAVIETVRVILAREKPEFSVRIVFAMELYGFAAYAASRGGYLRNEVIGGINYDGLYFPKILLIPAGPAVPYYGNMILKLIHDGLSDYMDYPELSYTPRGRYFDDISLSDSTVAVPSVWPLHAEMKVWHNSVQVPSIIEPELFRKTAAVNIIFAIAAASPDRSMIGTSVESALNELIKFRSILEAEFQKTSHRERFRYRASVYRKHIADFSRALGEDAVSLALIAYDRKISELEKGLSDIPQESKALQEAGKLIFSRVGTGLPNDLIRIPKNKRRAHSTMYDSIGTILADMDGHRDLRSLILRASYEENTEFDEQTISTIINKIQYFAEWNYLKIGSVKSNMTK